MNVLLADDAEMHRSLLKNVLSKVPGGMVVLGEAADGKELCDLYARHVGKIDLIFCDIRMPVMDGLSALVKIKSIRKDQKIVMVSSEDLARMQRINEAKGEGNNSSLDEAKKIELIEKVADRVRKGVVEAGKINSLLEGCEKLAADPILIARHFGANGYLRKPYDNAKLELLISKLVASQDFAAVV